MSATAQGSSASDLWSLVESAGFAGLRPAVGGVFAARTIALARDYPSVSTAMGRSSVCRSSEVSTGRGVSEFYEATKTWSAREHSARIH